VSETPLEVEGLSVALRGSAGDAVVVDALSFAVPRGATLAIVGESGCGKTMTALATMRLLPNSARITAGSVRVEGRDLIKLDDRAVQDLRGNRIAMIFQEPMTSLNPVLTVGEQLAEPLRRHRGLGARAAAGQCVELLRRVRMPDADRRLGLYPHQMSGGQRQRVMIAMALACEPSVLIADEPTTALDVTIQAQILRLLRDLQRELGLAVVLITHDLGIVRAVADRVLVMYAGRKVEDGDVRSVLGAPRHPYTRGLMAARPRATGAAHAGRLAEIPGMVPQPGARWTSCAFAARCALAEPRCGDSVPEFVTLGADHHAACLRTDAV
jgi:peptide/nickel transport system ATP-binding protein